MLRIFAVALALGLSNFAGAVGMGVTGVDNHLRRRVILTFGLFEVMMPLAGIGLGQHFSADLGDSAHYVASALLLGVGLYALGQGRRTSSPDEQRAHLRHGLVVTAAALSLDNLVVGVALGATRVPLYLAVAVIGVVSVTMSLVGLELGRRLGPLTEKYSVELGGVVLIGVGVGVALGR